MKINLKEELISFSSTWDEFSKSTTSKHEAQVDASTSYQDDDDLRFDDDEVDVFNDFMEDEDQLRVIETEAKDLKSVTCDGVKVKCNSCL